MRLTGEPARPDATTTAISRTIHATCVLVGEAGILIRGEAGSGKSGLALALIDLGGTDGRFAALVGDDRVGLSAQGGRLVARPHRALAGLIEMRGIGLVELPWEPAAVVRLCVDLVATSPRLPSREERTVELWGVPVRRHRVTGPPKLAAQEILRLLRGADDTDMTVSAY